VALLVVIDSSESLENPEHPALGPWTQQAPGCDDCAVPAVRAMGEAEFLRQLELHILAINLGIEGIPAATFRSQPR